MTHFGTTSCFLNIEYLQGHRVSIKLTKAFLSAGDFTVQVEFTRGRFPGTKWKFHSKDYRSNTWMNQQFSDLISQSNNVELSTVFVSRGCVSQERLQGEDALDILMDSLNPDSHVIQKLPAQPDFDIIFVIQRTDEELPPLVILFQPEVGTADITAYQNQIEHLQEQLEQNKIEIASLREQQRRQGGSDMQNQLNRLEILINSKHKEQRASSEKAEQHLLQHSNQKFKQHSEAAEKSLSQCTKKYNQKLDQLQKEFLKKVSSVVSQNQLLKNRLDTFGKYVRPIPAIQDGIATMSSNSTSIYGFHPQSCYLYGMHNESFRGWAARSRDKSNKKQYLKASFPQEYAVTGIAIAPRGDREVEYVTKFKLQTTTDVNEESDQCKWECIKTKDGGEEFESGITARCQAPVHINFQRPVMARAIRFMVTEWHVHPCMRCEVYVLEKELMKALR